MNAATIACRDKPQVSIIKHAPRLHFPEEDGAIACLAGADAEFKREKNWFYEDGLENG